MKYLKKYEANTIDSSDFEDFLCEDFLNNLKDLLLEYTDIDLDYIIKLKSFVKYAHTVDSYMPIDNNNVREPFNFKDIIKHKNDDVRNFVSGYQISFKKLFKGTDASDTQRGDNRKVFAIPNNKLYQFFDITKNIQESIESMGYIFMLSTHTFGEFDLMIIDDKSKK